MRVGNSYLDGVEVFRRRLCSSCREVYNRGCSKVGKASRTKKLELSWQKEVSSVTGQADRHEARPEEKHKEGRKEPPRIMPEHRA
jgi:hypothetical protein